MIFLTLSTEQTLAPQAKVYQCKKPLYGRPYPSTWKARKIFQILSEDMLQAGIIECSDSPWGAPVVLIKKKMGRGDFVWIIVA